MVEENCHAFLLAYSLPVGVGVAPGRSAGVARHPSACDCQASACDLRLGERELLIKPLVGHLCCFQAGNVNNAPSTPSILYTNAEF